jgi:hypothetical protein
LVVALPPGAHHSGFVSNFWCAGNLAPVDQAATVARSPQSRHMAAKNVGRETPQHLPRPMEILETSRPLGAMLIDCLQSDTLTFMAAVKLAPSIDSTKVLPV